MAVTKVPEHAEDDGTVYFCYDHAADSFSGTLEDQYSASDEQIREYIRYDNHTLYQRLYGLPFGSTDIPQGFSAQKRLKKVYEMRKTMDATSKIQPEEQITEHYAYKTLDSVPQNTNNPVAYVDFVMLDLQLKKHVQTCLLNGHSLELKKLPSRGNPLFCNNATCLSYGLVPYKSFYLTLKQDMYPNGYTSLDEICNQTHYCLTCLEDVFDGRQHDVDDVVKQVAGASFDGVDHDLIMKAASRLYNADGIEVAGKRMPGSNPELAPGSQPHSNRELEIRLKKRQDIEVTLNEVNRYERSRSRSQESADINSLPDLSNSRPFYMEAVRDRYRKQGWRRWDKEVADRKEKESQSLTAQLSPVSQLSVATPADRQCYCRELDLSMEDMIKCSNEWCSIGWFHLRCTGLKDNLPDNGGYLCEYCQDDFGPFSHLLEDKEIDEVTAANDMILEYADQLVEEEDEGEDTLDDEDVENEEEFTAIVKTPKWGIPINIQATEMCSPITSDITKQTQHDLTTPGNFPPAQTTTIHQVDGFTPINDAISNPAPNLNSGTATAFNAPSMTTFAASIPTEPITPVLPDSSSSITFTDLAPFISTEGLSTEENQVFEEWKFNLPPSRLVRVLMGGSYHDEEAYAAFGGQQGGSFGFDTVNVGQSTSQEREKRLSCLLCDISG